MEQFIRTLRPTDRAEVVEFSNNIKVRQQFTSNTGHLLDALTKTALPSGRALYAAVHTRLKALEQFTSQSGCSDCRQAIVFFAAGPDISSAIRANQLLAFVRRSRGVAIYGIAIPANGRSLDRETEFMLRQMAEITGGRAYFPVRFEDLPTVYSHIRDQLTGGSVPGASHATK